MNSKQVQRLSLLILAMFVVVMSGCGTTPPSSFYMLEPMATREASTATDRRDDVHIGIGPVEFAEYLERTQIVTRTDSAEVRLADTHRWAEPLNKNFGRVLAQNLSILMNTDKTSLHPSRNWSEIDFQVLVNVWQFDASKEGEVTLVANWSIRVKGGTELLSMKKSTYSANVGVTATYSDIAQALSKTIELLSREIANAILAEQA